MTFFRTSLIVMLLFTIGCSAVTQHTVVPSTQPMATSVPANPGEILLFRKQLGGGNELAIIRGQKRSASDNDIADLLSLAVDQIDPEPGGAATVSPIRVEYRSPNKPPLIVGFCLFYETKVSDNKDSGYEVLDVRMDHLPAISHNYDVESDKPGSNAPRSRVEIVVATGEGGAICLWSFDPGYKSRFAYLAGGAWGVIQAAIPTDPALVHVKLSRNKNNLVEIEVNDRNEKRTRFIQTAIDKWEFKCVESVDLPGDASPATQP